MKLLPRPDVTIPNTVRLEDVDPLVTLTVCRDIAFVIARQTAYAASRMKREIYRKTWEDLN